MFSTALQLKGTLSRGTCKERLMNYQLQPRQEKALSGNAKNWRKTSKAGPETYNSQCVAYTQRKLVNNKISERNKFRDYESPDYFASQVTCNRKKAG
jgi:hypothetical protein